MTHDSFRRLASIAAGLVALAAVTFTAASAAPIVGHLSKSVLARGIFHFEIFQLNQHTDGRDRRRFCRGRWRDAAV